MNGAEHYPFTPRPLPYPANALCPWLNTNTVKIHHDSHYAGYIKRLNDTLKNYPQMHHLPIEALLIKQAFLPDAVRTDIRRFAGGAFNHQLYFECLTPANCSKISPDFEKIICSSFGSIKAMMNNLKSAAMSVFGSGYAYLTSDMSGKMQIIILHNQETPVEQRLNPLLPIDVWEHAYYLQYQNHRERYLNSLMKIINWKAVEKNYYS